jgi:hypothetical protein
MEIAAQGFVAHHVARPRKNARAKSFATNSAVALKFDAFDGGRSFGGSGGDLLRWTDGNGTGGNAGNQAHSHSGKQA